MELSKAIQRVAKVCPRKKDQASLQVIRFFPSQQGGSPWLYATDGLRSALVKVDREDLPNVLLPADDLVKAAKDPGELEVIEAGFGKVELRTDTATYQLQGLNFDSFPAIPPMPAQYTLIQKEYWAEVAKAFHAAGKETADPELAVVHFTPDFVEATDKNRLVRVEIPGPWSGLVPARAFTSWPKGEVQVAFTTTHAFFWIGDELRVTSLLTNPNYPKTDNMIPPEYPAFVLVETAAFRDAILQGMAMSGLGIVNLDVNPATDNLVIRAWQEDAEESAYVATIPILHGNRGPAGMLLVTGKYVHEALQKVTTPNVKLGYGSISDPLRMEAGLLTACVWQMVLG